MGSASFMPTGFTAADGYNGMCHYTGAVPHIFQYLVKWSPMKTRSNGSFTRTAKGTVGQFTGTFRVRGRFSSGKAHGTVTRIGPGCDNDLRLERGEPDRTTSKRLQPSGRRGQPALAWASVPE